MILQDFFSVKIIDIFYSDMWTRVFAFVKDFGIFHLGQLL